MLWLLELFWLFWLLSPLVLLSVFGHVSVVAGSEVLSLGLASNSGATCVVFVVVVAVSNRRGGLAGGRDGVVNMTQFHGCAWCDGVGVDVLVSTANTVVFTPFVVHHAFTVLLLLLFQLGLRRERRNRRNAK